MTADDWQPMETAPRDGRYIIAARFINGDEMNWVTDSRWMTAEDFADFHGGIPDDYDAGWSDGDTASLCTPTHWMPLRPPRPLPAPPDTGE